MDITVSLARNPSQSFGIGFKKMPHPPYCQVYKLVQNGAARQSGKILEGDLLLNINGRNVQHLTPDEVREVLSRCAQDTTILFELRRHVRTTNAGSQSSVECNGHLPNLPEALEETQSPPSSTSILASQQTQITRNMRRMPAIDTSYSDTKDVITNTNVNDKWNDIGVSLSERKRLSLTPDAERRTMLGLKPAKSLDLANLPQWRQHTTPQVALHNLISETEMFDRLHNQGIKVKDTGCHDTHCLGSHMWPKDHRPKRPPTHPRTREEMWPLAEDFIKQYYQSKKHAIDNSYIEKMQTRLNQVKAEIDERGFYDLTYEEIAFGARLAWRNAPRCVNRIVWRQLEVLDGRGANTPKEMFDAICHHIKYANNGGNLRSTITVFQPRTKPSGDFRVWNAQLIRYAGYKQKDGTILGDPSNVEFTEICERLGWKAPYDKTGYDILPLVLQAHGGEAHWFQIPPEIILEAKIIHPEYSWFEDLGMKWYGLPAVSNVLLDVGGMEFPAAPFSGWYMGSEIGRDLGDINRYNMLKPIATKMGLNTQTNMKLWKDKAFVELNLAVLHSFQKAGISIVDHHSATESFITHMKSETQTRGGCPADWVWIVPPISGSITPVFHQEMLLYYLTPSYEYQDEPWKHYHHWPVSEGRGRSGSLTFKGVVQLVRNTNRLFRGVYQKRVKATIVYATETGRSRNYANIVKDVFGRVFAAKVVCMDDYDRAHLEHEQVLIVVTSTFGSGDPPSNGETFGRYLLDLRNGAVAPPGTKTLPTPRSHRMSTIVAPTREMLDNVAMDTQVDKPLTQVKYAVFGLGSRAYPNFCTFAHTCDNLLRDLGAEQLICCGEGDELCGQEESFQQWLQQCYLKSCQTYQVDVHEDETDWEGYRVGYSKDNFRIQEYSKPQPERTICSNLKHVHSKGVFPAVLKSRVKLQSPSSDRSTILVMLEKNGQKFDYEPGDHIAIYPQNSAKVVNELIDSLNLPIGPDKPIYVESRRDSTGGVHWVEEKRLPVPVTLREAFTYYLDITNPPTPQLIKLLAKQATRMSEQEELNELAKGGDKYEDWKYTRFPSLADVVSQFHSLKLDASLLLQQVPLLQCRYYSISSSPRMYPNEIHATVAIVAFKKKSGIGPWHNGVCSTWLNRVEPGSVIPCFVRKAHAFHMPEDPRVPIIMVGPGTGIAPYRAFWQDRLYKKNESLKSQLSTPSITQTQPPEPPVAANQGLSKRRRVTTIERPNLSLLQAPTLKVGTQNPSSGLPMRRSLSDADDTDDIAQMLAAKQKAWGQMSLYFGCRRSNVDFIYKEEMKKAQVAGALSQVNVAFSREPNKPKTYVQHLLKENADNIVKQLIEERGHFYVCGDISMAADVSRTLQGIFEETAAMSAEVARKLIDTMKDKGFYHEDIFGVTLKHQEVTTRVRTAVKKAWRILVSTDGASTPMTPITPYARMPSPSPISRGGLPPFPTADKSSIYESSSLGRSLRSNTPSSFSKRTTVTVLSPTSAMTPTDIKREPSRGSSSVDISSDSLAKKRQKWGSVGAASIDDSLMLPHGSTKLLEDSNVKILETLSEAAESPVMKSPPIITMTSPSPTIPEGGESTDSKQSPLVTSPVDTVVDRPTNLKEEISPKVEISTSSASELDKPDEPVVSKQVEKVNNKVSDTASESPGGEKPQVGEVTVVKRRETSDEKRRTRRIRTNSQIETCV